MLRRSNKVCLGMVAGVFSSVVIANPTTELSPKTSGSGVIWEGEDVTITYERPCRVQDYGIIPSVHCYGPFVHYESWHVVDDSTLGGIGDRRVKMSDMTIWVDKYKQRYYELSASKAAAEALEESRFKSIKVSIPRQVGEKVSQSEYVSNPDPLPEPRIAEYVLADFDDAIESHRNVTYQETLTEVNEIIAIRAGAAVLALLVGIFIIAKTLPRMKRRYHALGYSVMNVKKIASRMNYNRKLKKRLEEIELEDEARKRIERDLKRRELDNSE